MQVVVAGGCDFYPGSATSSPSFSFSVIDLRVAGEGDLLARIDRLRKALDAEGLLERQRRLHLPLLPRTIGVITGESGKARDDILAALHRRGWAGRLVWGFAPVQDRHAAPAIVRALGDLATVGEVEVAIVARGGGSLADLLCFCDETLCRTVALLGVPVIASVGHHTDRTLLDDVAAVSAPHRRTPRRPPSASTACAPALTPPPRRRGCWITGDGRSSRSGVCRPPRHAYANMGGGPCSRALVCSRRSPAHPPGISPASARGCTSNCARSAPAHAGACQSERALTARRLLVLAAQESSQRSWTAADDIRTSSDGSLSTLAAHDPQRTLERGYALVQSSSGEPLPTAVSARAVDDVRLRFADATIPARILA